MPDHTPPIAVPHETAARLHERYGQAAPHNAAWNPIISGLLQHRSVRAYLPTPLDAGVIPALIAAAQSAATSSNLQTWSVVAVHDQARRDRLAVLAGGQKHISQAPLLFIWLADLSRAQRLGDAAATTMETLPYLEPFMVAVIDAALAAQNATVAAESLGLGTVYIGAMRNHPEAVAAELNLPAGVMPVFGLCVGHEDPAAPPATVKPRLPQSAVLYHETYDTSAEPDAIAAYDDTLRAFQAGQSMKQQGWTDLILARLGPVKSLNGRDKLRQAMESLGFPLK